MRNVFLETIESEISKQLESDGCSRNNPTHDRIVEVKLEQFAKYIIGLENRINKLENQIKELTHA